MKHLLLTTIAALLVVGCGESQPPESPTAEAQDISIHHAASRYGNIEAVKQHLAAGADVNAIYRRGWSPLHYATIEDHKEIVELLIAKGADVNAKGVTDSTPLHHAAFFGHKEVTELLITAGADVNAKGDDGTPLHHAALRGLKEIVELLIANGADVNTKGGWMVGTPLHYVVVGGHMELVELLIAEGTDVNVKDGSGGTPLDWAIVRPGRTKTADFLRKHGGKTAADISIHKAAEKGNIEAVKQHLAAGTDVNAKTGGGGTPLLYATAEG